MFLDPLLPPCHALHWRIWTGCVRSRRLKPVSCAQTLASYFFFLTYRQVAILSLRKYSQFGAIVDLNYMDVYPSFSEESDFCEASWVRMLALCLFNAVDARLSCDEATIHGAVEFVKMRQKSAVQSNCSLSDAEKEIRLRQLDCSAPAIEALMRNAIKAAGLLR